MDFSSPVCSRENHGISTNATFGWDVDSIFNQWPYERSVVSVDLQVLLDNFQSDSRGFYLVFCWESDKNDTSGGETKKTKQDTFDFV